MMFNKQSSESDIQAGSVKILICAVPYSANLGDAVIAACLSTMLRKQLSNCEVRYLDIAGRQNFDDTEGKKTRKRLFQALQTIPERLRFIFVALAFKIWIEPKLSRLWRQKTEWCDIAIIGGGQLLMDHDLNFPLKLHRLSITLSKRRTTTFVYACGVGDKWSSLGGALFRKMFENLRPVSISVRDTRSLMTLESHLASKTLAAKIGLTIDPAVNAAQTYGPAPARNTFRPTVALGVSSPDIINGFIPREARHSSKYFRKIFLEVAIELSSQFDIVFFTNGSHEDRLFLAELESKLCNANSDTIRFAPAPETPTELVDIIKSADVVVSHRLHANIIAYSYKIPSVALGWDPKLHEFLLLCDREEYFIQNEAVSTKLLIQTIISAHQSKVENSRHSEILTSANKGLEPVVSFVRATAKNHIKR